MHVGQTLLSAPRRSGRGPDGPARTFSRAYGATGVSPSTFATNGSMAAAQIA